MDSNNTNDIRRLPLWLQRVNVERFNRTARQEWLELNLFEDIEHAQILATQWQWTYNNYRPHS
ncbi:MAG: putative transposase, partial [Cellvibrionaceae bacterium]